VDPVAAPDTATDVNTSALPTVSAPPGADATPTQRVPATGPSALAAGAQLPPAGGPAAAPYAAPPAESYTAPPAEPYAAPPAEELGIPPSLAPMLSGQDEPYAHRTEPLGGGTYGTRPAAGPGPGQGPGSGQGSPNAAILIAVALVTLLAVVPGVLLLYSALFDGDMVSASGAVSGTLMLIGLPLLATGLYPLIGGSATAPDGVRGLLRPPYAYLVVGMVLLLAAGLAAG
ncbi:MAG: hypothetical protein ACRDT6_22670, partial [Micromonosporaceae bacterium]